MIATTGTIKAEKMAMNFVRRFEIKSIDSALNLNDFTDTTKSILCFIAFEGTTNITAITKHTYFSEVSFSTIKRSIVVLLMEGKIKKAINTKDRRESLLSLVV
jgi:hypothetical protein